MIEDYTEKMSAELMHLNKDNQAYMKKMIAYIGVKSYFYDDELLGEQLYNMVCDLKVAEKEGNRAVDYFGKDPRAMMDQVLSELPRRRLGSYVGLFLILGTIFVGMRFVMDFAWMLPLVIAPLTYLLDLLIFFVYSQFMMWLWSKQSYGEIKWPWALIISVISLILSPRIEHVFSDHLSLNRSIPLTDGWAIVLAFLLLLGFTIMTYRNQGRLAVSLLDMGVTFFVTGCCVRFVNPGTANLLRWLLPLIGLVLSFIVFRLQRKGETS